MHYLESGIEYIKGVGPQKADMLKRELNVFTINDLLQHYPFRYVDKTKFTRIGSIMEESISVLCKGVIRSFDVIGEGFKARLVANIRDESGVMELIWFQGVNFIKNQITIGSEYIIYGKVSIFNGRVSIVHPEIEKINTENVEPSLAFEAVYPTTEKLKQRYLDSKALRNIIKTTLQRMLEDRTAAPPEPLPQYLLDELRLCGKLDALCGIHSPLDEADMVKARNRLKFEELFLLQLRLLYGKARRSQASKGLVFGTIGTYFNTFYNEKLPFSLTNAQKRVLREIRQDAGSGKQMNRLLQGDVGSGKTIVGLMTMLMALDNGFQSALMAPTEILAQQHFIGISSLLEDFGVPVRLLTGSTKTKARREILAGLEDGSIPIVIGTHALLEDKVIFNNLGLSIIDEQHRFGVEQRSKLWTKTRDGKPPHVLVMTATPIPRTLAMTFYGDLDVSVIDELPPGRIPIKTVHNTEAHRLRLVGFLREQIALGRQIYVVYPLIEESEHRESLLNLMAGFEQLEREFPKPQYQISIVHGQLKSADKEFEMQRFVKGETQIMVATTVIEVGVNVPNASVMVIENADQFGLAQLHQLRGRVGRGASESFCVLMTGYKLSADGRERIQTMVKTTNGFEIAEADLKLRGPGNIEGRQQSGIINLRLAELAKDGKILDIARNKVTQILTQDPNLANTEHLGLRQYLQSQNKETTWGKIS
jgi:ATP-dependent DNA helicase RecG